MRPSRFVNEEVYSLILELDHVQGPKAHKLIHSRWRTIAFIGQRTKSGIDTIKQCLVQGHTKQRALT